MKEKVRELRQQRAALIAKAREVYDLANNGNRDMTGEEQGTWNNYMAEIDKLDGKIQTAERMAALEDVPGGSAGRMDPTPQPGAPVNVFATREYEAAFEKRLRFGREAEFLPEEQRAIVAGTNANGGYTVAPEQFVRKLLMGLDSAVGIRALATKHELSTSTSLGVPTLDGDFNDADWTTELLTGSLDENLTFGKRELKPNPLAKRTKVSNTLLRVSALPIEQIVRDRLLYKFAITEEKAFMTGDGSGKPLGIFTASANGIPTSRDVVCGSTTDPTYEGLIDMKFALKTGYWSKARWSCNKDFVKKVLKIKDGSGRYILDPNSPVADKILDLPYMLSDFAPATFTTGQYVAVLGDFSNYWIATALDMQIQRLTELYAETNQTGFIGRLESDGQPVLAEAFVRGKLG